MGVVIMSATRMTKLLDAEDKPPLEDFYRYVLGHPAVSLSVMGLRSVEDFERVARRLERASGDWSRAGGRGWRRLERG